MLLSVIYIFFLFELLNCANVEKQLTNQIKPEAECVFSVHDKGPNGPEVSG